MNRELPLSWLLTLGALSAFAPMAIDMYLPAFPAIASELQTDSGQVQLTMAACFLGFAIGQLLYGPLSDRFGRKPPLYAGIALFVIASAGCALANSIDSLIVWRFLQAFGGCAGMVIGRAIVRDRFQANEAARLFSLLILVMGLAPILAPLFGGVLLSVASWRAIFIALLVFGLLCGVASWRALSETLPAERRQSLHPIALARGFGEILRHREFYGHVLVGGFAHAGMFAYITSSSFVFIEHFQIAPSHFGWLFGANAAGLIAMSQLNRHLLKTRSTSRLLQAGNRLALLMGATLLLGASLAPQQLLFIAAPLFGFVASLGITLPNASANALAPFGLRAGTASALMGTIQFLFATVSAGAVSHFASTKPVVMAGFVAGCALLAWLGHRLLLQRSDEQAMIS